ncbi:hypothetical protein [Burkholderia ambifaria]|uniref:hypothetical protein n=1 Tax=Burkholderia ambifaria TaxID=152480 RepID=UPI00158A1527|nr:hypothetical protein [Burkholderia ambifaria]
MRLIGADIDGANAKVGPESCRKAVPRKTRSARAAKAGRFKRLGRPAPPAGRALPALVLADDRGGSRLRVARDAVVHARADGRRRRLAVERMAVAVARIDGWDPPSDPAFLLIERSIKNR